MTNNVINDSNYEFVNADRGLDIYYKLGDLVVLEAAFAGNAIKIHPALHIDFVFPLPKIIPSGLKPIVLKVEMRATQGGNYLIGDGTDLADETSNSVVSEYGGSNIIFYVNDFAAGANATTGAVGLRCKITFTIALEIN